MLIILLAIIWVLYYKFNYKLSASIKLIFKSLLAISLLTVIILDVIGPIFVILGTTLSIVLLILIIIFMIFLYYNFNRKREEEIKQWLRRPINEINSMDFIQILDTNCNTDSVLYKGDTIPYNRAQYFLSGENINIDSDKLHVIYYNAKSLKNNMHFQEEGYIVTNKGILVKYLGIQDKRIDEPKIESIFLPFQNIYKVTIDSKNNLKIYYTDKNIKKLDKLTPDERRLIHDIIVYSIESSWSRVVDRELHEDVDYSELEKLDNAVDTVNKNLTIKEKNKIVADVMSSVNVAFNTQAVLNESQLNDRFFGAQGHGHVGEQMGNTVDRLKFKTVTALGNNHVKHGADRIVNGENIQTKFCSSARKSIGQAFDGDTAKYLNNDGTMMIIEVPKDQYTEGIKEMRKAINKGKVPQESNPDNAKNYVKKGGITYRQAKIATKSIFDRNSTITIDGKVQKVTFLEKLAYSAGSDFATGVSAALPSSIVAGVWIFCNNKWQGVENDKALKNAVKSSVKPILVSGTVFMLSAQFSRSNLAGNMFKKVGLDLSKSGARDSLMRGTMIGVTVAMTVGPDIVDALRGRISMNQLVKNTVITGGSFATGALAGMALGGPIGGLVGGTVGSFVFKKTLDNFIEDDAVSMICIAKEEFIEEVIMNGLSREEFDSVLSRTFLHKDFSTLLKKMYASGEPRQFIKEVFCKEVIECYNGRELPKEEEILDVVVTTQLIK